MSARSSRQLFRFCLYGFLKNQRYFEPFLLLAMLERGLGFTEIGLLLGIREVCTAVLEIPSGALGDGVGRRSSMVAAFVGYLLSYLVMGAAHDFALFTVGMLLLGAADAFRTGTHKAMIFQWLTAEGRSDERVKVYGLTRSWSQIGSAVSVVIAALIVAATGRYDLVFWLAAVPAALNIINLATYPRALEGERDRTSLAGVFAQAGRTLLAVWRSRPMRGLLVEAAAFEGTYKAGKDYLQPVLAGFAAVWLAFFTPTQAVALAAGATYVVLHLLSALASRRAHRWVERFATPARGSRVLWTIVVAVWVALVPLLWWGVSAGAAVGFMTIAILHNVFRPILVSRIDEVSDAADGATVLSIESQASSLVAMILAPLVGWGIDAALTAGLSPGPELWPVAVACAAVTLAAMLHVRAVTSEPTPRE